MRQPFSPRFLRQPLEIDPTRYLPNQIGENASFSKTKLTPYDKIVRGLEVCPSF